jgi:hypothetical protein
MAFSLSLSQVVPAVRPTSGVAHTLLVVVFAALLSLPALLAGIPPGYDSDYHTAYQFHFSRQFWSGEIYPRWLPGHNKGHGSPIFLIQYPLPYFGAALLRPLTSFPPSDTREARELGVVCFLAFAGAALAARAWFRRRCSAWAATLAAGLYISLPYVLGQALYLRTGLGELCALVWMPLALAVCETALPRFVAVSALAAVFALLLLTHATSAVLFAPLLIAYAAIVPRASAASAGGGVILVIAAMALGVGLAAVYVLPFLAYRSLFDLKAMETLFPSFELGRWFPYVTPASVMRRFAGPAIVGTAGFVAVVAVYVWRVGGGRVARVCMVATLALGSVVMIPNLGPYLIRWSGLTVTSFETAGDFSTRMLITSLSTVALGFLAYAVVSRDAGSRERLLVAVVCGSFVLMLPWSAPLWTSAALGNIQFPFRLGGVLTLAVAGLVGIALDTGLRPGTAARRPLIALSVAALVVIAAGAFTWRVPERFLSPDTTRLALVHNVDNMFRSYVAPGHVRALAARLGTAADSFEVRFTAVDARARAEVIPVDVTDGRCSAAVVPVTPRVLRLAAQCTEPARLQIGQLYSPLWRIASTSGQTEHPGVTRSADGLIVIALTSGRYDVDLVFDGGWPERAGTIVTFASVAIAAGGSVFVGLRTSARKSGRIAA